MLSFEVPPEFEKVEVSDSNLFDISNLDGKEIWILRTPNNFDSSTLNNLEIDYVKSKKAEKPLFNLKTEKSDGFELFHAGDGEEAGGLEINGLKILLPDQIDTKEYCQAPKSKRVGLIVKEKVIIPNLVDAGKRAKEKTKPLTRKQLPNMKLMFKPFGFNSKIKTNEIDSQKDEPESKKLKSSKPDVQSKPNPETQDIAPMDVDNENLNTTNEKNKTPSKIETPKNPNISKPKKNKSSKKIKKSA
ncbi:hypothetical protein AYI68_g1665 [Smittium mucronatum]|uniref:DNA-directed RNA polymerase I subunit RPA34 n=1 Tax=Smittium mucronatum TaxID=133383 RepID=A0A1R0H4N3_9FUNG|nr:hypothetical protein AYI68_g1665 [Smittium mucronatum]